MSLREKGLKREAETAIVYYQCMRMNVPVKGKLPFLLLMVVHTKNIRDPYVENKD